MMLMYVTTSFVCYIVEFVGLVLSFYFYYNFSCTNFKGCNMLYAVAFSSISEIIACSIGIKNLENVF